VPVPAANWERRQRHLRDRLIGFVEVWRLLGRETAPFLLPGRPRGMHPCQRIGRESSRGHAPAGERADAFRRARRILHRARTCVVGVARRPIKTSESASGQRARRAIVSQDTNPCG